VFPVSRGKKGLRNSGLKTLRKGDVEKRQKEEGLILQRGREEIWRRYTASSSRTVENVALRTTIFGRGVFLSLALGVPKGAISRRKKRAVSCRRMSPFTMQSVQHFMDNRERKYKKDVRARVRSCVRACVRACVRSPRMYTETRLFSTN